MAGYKLIDKDWQKLANDPNLPQLLCPYCSWLMKEPMASPCGHKFCRGCLFFGESISESNSLRNSSVAVCPVDGKEFLLREIVPDEEADKQIKSLRISCTFECDDGKLCEWYGLVMHLEIHWKNYHCKEEASAKELGEAKKAPQHDTLLNPAPSPNWPEAAIAGPSGVSLLKPQERPQDDPLISGNSCCDNPTYALSKSIGDQSLRDVAQTLMCQQSTIECLNQQIASISATVQVLEQRQSLDRNDVAQMKRQLEALGDAVVTRKQDYEQLQDKVQALQNMEQPEQLQQLLVALDDIRATVTRQGERLQEEVRKEFCQIKVMEQQQSTDHNDIEELKRQLAVFTGELAEEKQNNGRLRDELGTAHGKIKALEQELEAQKKTCASARDECAAERERGIEAQSMESGLFQGYIGNLPTRCASLEARFEDERPSGF